LLLSCVPPSLPRPDESHSGPGESILMGPYNNLILTETSRQLSTGKTSHVLPSFQLACLSLLVSWRQGRGEEGQAPKARELGRRTWSKAPRGWVKGGDPPPHREGFWEGLYPSPLPENFCTFQWKMARFGALWECGCYLCRLQ